jgi:uncharacterized protein
MANLSPDRLRLSPHNIVGPIDNSDEYFIVNLLTGNADILDSVKASEVRTGKFTGIEEYAAKGYLAIPEEEEALYRKKYADFIDNRDRDEIQIFYVPWYACNFGCDYCYQSGYDHDPSGQQPHVIDAFFDYVKSRFSGRKKYLTLFGGEPLLRGAVYEDTISHFLEKAKEAGLETAIVTNGFHLEAYLDILSKYRIREIQVTLDGLSALHDARRPLKGGGPTFDAIVAGIDAALKLGLNINLRVVVDRDNLQALPELARFAIGRGWTGMKNFKTQLGRNYELHYCQTGHGKLLSRLEMYREIYSLARRVPELLEFHKPAFSITKFLFDQGKLPAPLFDSCPGTKNEWAFDSTGTIYSCTATVGKKEEALGTFFPQISHMSSRIAEWEERDITSVPECRECSLRLACGAGCASVASNQTGRLHAPDCRPIREAIGMGISLYFQNDLETEHE